VHPSRILTVISLLIAASAQAQDAAPANAAEGSVPDMSCTAPALPPRVEPAQDQIDRYNRQLPVYKQCVQDYVEQRKQAVNRYNALARQNADAGAKAIDAFNQFNAKARQQLQDNN